MGTKLRYLKSGLRSALVLIATGFFACAAIAAPTVQDIEFSSRPGSQFEVRLEFNETPPDFKTYAIEKPARIQWISPEPAVLWSKSATRCPMKPTKVFVKNKKMFSWVEFGLQILGLGPIF